jgi:hypothetical protein
MSVTINGTSGVTFNDASSQNTAATGFGFKNRIINGAMVIDQRNAGASVTPISGQFVADRFYYTVSQASKLTAQQSSITSLAGFINMLRTTSSSAYSVLSTDIFALRQPIEGLNVADLSWGTANAATVTLSFWVRSTLTGTFGGSLRNSAADRSYPFSYTISAANTWEQKSITVVGDTSGTWLTTNGVGILLSFGLGVGSTNSGTAGAWAAGSFISATGATSVVGTNGATFDITGVQLEKGSTATSFDYRPYGTELALCQRYYYRISAAGANFTEYGTGYINTTSTAQVLTIFPVTMRTAPSAVEQSGTAANYGVLNLNVGTTSTSVPTFSYASVATARTVFTTAATLVAGQGCMGRSESTAAYLGWSAEL